MTETCSYKQVIFASTFFNTYCDICAHYNLICAVIVLKHDLKKKKKNYINLIQTVRLQSLLPVLKYLIDILWLQLHSYSLKKKPSNRIVAQKVLVIVVTEVSNLRLMIVYVYKGLFNQYGGTKYVHLPSLATNQIDTPLHPPYWSITAQEISTSFRDQHVCSL